MRKLGINLYKGFGTEAWNKDESVKNNNETNSEGSDIVDILQTKHLEIRRFMQEDWEDLHEYLSDENVVKYEPYGVLNKEECKKKRSDV